MISTSSYGKSSLMFKLNIFSCSHVIVSSLSYPAWSWQLSEGLHVIIISGYLDSKLCCKASDKSKVSSLEYLMLTIRKICCLQVQTIVLLSGFVLASYYNSKIADFMLVSPCFQLPPRSVSHINQVFYISQEYFLPFVLTELSTSLNTCEILSL